MFELSVPALVIAILQSLSGSAAPTPWPTDISHFDRVVQVRTTDGQSLRGRPLRISDGELVVQGKLKAVALPRRDVCEIATTKPLNPGWIIGIGATGALIGFGAVVPGSEAGNVFVGRGVAVGSLIGGGLGLAIAHARIPPLRTVYRNTDHPCASSTPK